jgi:large subunit ribosomal protein L21
MFAVVTTGGKQYRVEAGSELLIERLPDDAGSTVTFDRVLLVGEGDDVTLGTPTVDGASVTGTVIGEALGPKLVVFKFKQKVKYRRHAGHRQHLTRVRIDEIAAKGRSSKAKEPERAAKEPAAEAPAKATRKPRAKATAAKADEAQAAEAPAAEAPAAEAEKPKRTRRAPAKPKAAEAEE